MSANRIIPRLSLHHLKVSFKHHLSRWPLPCFSHDKVLSCIHHGLRHFRKLNVIVHKDVSDLWASHLGRCPYCTLFVPPLQSAHHGTLCRRWSDYLDL